LDSDNIKIHYSFQNFVDLAFQQLNKLSQLSISLNNCVGKKQGFDLGYQIQTTQGLNNQVCVVPYIMHTINIWSMFQRQLIGDIEFHTLKNSNPIYSKTNQFVCNFNLIQAPYSKQYC
jgi:hypothetical protein